MAIKFKTIKKPIKCCGNCKRRSKTDGPLWCNRTRYVENYDCKPLWLKKPKVFMISELEILKDGQSVKLNIGDLIIMPKENHLDWFEGFIEEE